MSLLINKRLGRIWFLVWFLGASICLITRAIQRYIDFKMVQHNKVFDRDIQTGVMNFYLICIIVAIALSVLGLYCTLFRTGNYANDSMQFGEKLLDFKLLRMQLQREQINFHLIADDSCFKPHLWHRLKCHSPPFYLSLYLAMCVGLLLALPYLDSERIRNGFSGTNSPLHSNLDMIFKVDNKYQDSFRQSSNFEFFNLCIGLLLYMFSYSQVFWKFNKMFALLFSLIVLLSGLVFALDMALVEMLVKVSIDPDQHMYIYSPQALTFFSIVAYVFSIIHQMALFEYGYIRLSETLLEKYSNGNTDSCPTYNDGTNNLVPLISLCKQLCAECWSGVLLPFVIGIFSVVLNVVIRLSYIYKSMKIIYPQSKDSLVFTNLIVAILYMTLTMVLWVCLLLRTNWPIKSPESSVEGNGDCSMHVRRHSKNVPQLPIYASVNRHPVPSPQHGQEPMFPVFCDPGNSQWRYSCSPPSCGPNDSNSDRTASCQNGDIGNNNNKNYIMMMRGNPSMVDSPNIGHGIYSQLIKLTPQTSNSDNNASESLMAQNNIPNDVSESSSNQTVHIIGPVTLDLSRGTIERTSVRNRLQNSSEYFNIHNYTPSPVGNIEIYDHGASITTDPGSTNLCSQV